MKIDVTQIMICYLCGAGCVEEDFCPGCQRYVCPDCDQIHPQGKHITEYHKKGSLQDIVSKRHKHENTGKTLSSL
jgi:hypothetical protein